MQHVLSIGKNKIKMNEKLKRSERKSKYQKVSKYYACSMHMCERIEYFGWCTCLSSPFPFKRQNRTHIIALHHLTLCLAFLRKSSILLPSSFAHFPNAFDQRLSCWNAGYQIDLKKVTKILLCNYVDNPMTLLCVLFIP